MELSSPFSQSSSQMQGVNENCVEYRVYPQRFWILFIYAVLSFNQCMFWLTFSPIASSTEEFYHVSETFVDLLLNWGPITFLPTLPIAYLILNTKHGFRQSILLYAILSLVGTSVRLIPLLIVSPSDQSFHEVSIPFLHLGQIIIGITGPFAMAVSSQLSCLWFASHERTRATTIGVLAPQFGGALAFVVSPNLVSEPNRVPYLLYFHSGLAFLACLCTFIYFPAEPPTPPSSTAQILLNESSRSEKSIDTIKRFGKDLLQCFRNISCLLLILAGAILYGTFSSWTGLFATILKPLNYTETEAGWFGFGQSIAGIVGALTVGYIADLPRFQRSLKAMMLIVLTIALIFCLIFQLSINTLLWPDHPLIPSNSVSIGFLLTITGLFTGAASPLIYECLAEMMYPLPESLTASIYSELFNLVALIFVAVAPNQYKLMNLLVLLLMTISVIMILFSRITYKRKDAEIAKLKLSDKSLNDRNTL